MESTSTNGEELPPPAASPINYEEKYTALQAKMQAWKATVSSEMSDAAMKNKTLREELKAAREGAEESLATLRLRLTKEFKERTQMQQDELDTLNAQVTRLREEKREQAQTHEKDLKAAEVRERELCKAEAEREALAAVENWKREVSQLQASLGVKEKDVAQAQHEASLLTTRLERLGRQYDELSEIIQVGQTAAASAGGNEEGETAEALDANSGGGRGMKDSSSVIAANDMTHQRQIDAVGAELANKQRQTEYQLDQVRREYEQERQALIGEVQQREEQLTVLQSLLRQTQAEVTTMQQRLSQFQAERHGQEQHYTAKISALSRELAVHMEELHNSTQETEEAHRRLASALGQIESLEADAVSREEALRALMLSDDDKQLVQQLQRSLHESRDETEGWKQRCAKLQEELRATSTLPTVDFSTAGREVQQQHHFEGREAALAQRETRLEARMQQLRATETKLDEMKKTVAQQASIILKQRGHAEGGGEEGSSSGEPHTRLSFDNDEQSYGRAEFMNLRTMFSSRWYSCASRSRLQVILSVAVGMIFLLMLSVGSTQAKA